MCRRRSVALRGLRLAHALAAHTDSTLVRFCHAIEQIRWKDFLEAPALLFAASDGAVVGSAAQRAGVGWSGFVHQRHTRRHGGKRQSRRLGASGPGPRPTPRRRLCERGRSIAKPPVPQARKPSLGSGRAFGPYFPHHAPRERRHAVRRGPHLLRCRQPSDGAERLALALRRSRHTRAHPSVVSGRSREPGAGCGAASRNAAR